MTTQLAQTDCANEETTKERHFLVPAIILQGTSEDAAIRPIPAVTELAFLSETSLLNNIALDILSTFMLALAAGIEKIGASTTGLLPSSIARSNRASTDSFHRS